ncbi:ArsC family reductase [Corticibacterium sp. UT-5YL-CI-8]|nr:ArsC family reductase [Tianweitania sp. UT-5YL-CI-8]
MTTTIYGIKNCDTMKKARSWLEAHGVDYAFHDYKASGIDRASLERWCAEFGWEKVLNRAGTTFKKLPDDAKAALDQEKAIALMLEQPSMIKRPVLDRAGALTLGFKPELYDQAIGE